MVSDFFFPQPGGVESHIYQLSSASYARLCYSTMPVTDSRTETDRSRSQSHNYHTRIRLSRPLWYTLFDQPPQGLPYTSLGCLPVNHIPNCILILSNFEEYFHPRTDPDRTRSCVSQQSLPRGYPPCSDDEPSHCLHRS